MQRIDVATRSRLSERMYMFPYKMEVMVVRYDPFGDRFLVGYSTGPSWAITGYRVESLRF